METLCDITIEIGGYRKQQEREIKRVCMVEWAFRTDDFCHIPVKGSRKMMLQASAMGTLYGGEGMQDIVERLERSVWRANGGMCHVKVTARCVNSRGVFDPVEEEDKDLVAV